jgi:fumarate reductase subunit D
MLRLSRVCLPVLLAALALLSAAAPAAAHPGLAAPVPPGAGAPARIEPIVPVLTAASATPALPWYLPIALALAAAAAWLRPRRTVVVALVLLLGVFAFENALHSVHHGLDAKQHRECAIASASAHLAAVEVDGATDAVRILLVAERPADSATSGAPTRFPSPVQGRAPPDAIL